MCVVIDMNVIKAVFNSDNQEHEYFKPVQDWILNGKGKMVVGGNTYYQELSELHKFRRFFLALRKAGKVVVGGDEDTIDTLEEQLKNKLSHRDFDDPHIVALLIVSGCKVICSNDVRAYPFFQKKDWYPKGQGIPKIYCGRSYTKSDEILCDTNIANICLPCTRLNKSTQDGLCSIPVS